MSIVSRETERYFDGPDVVPGSWAPELHQSHVTYRHLAWSPYQRRRSSQEHRGPDVELAVTRASTALRRQRAPSLSQGSGEANIYSAEGEWASGSPDDGIRSAVPMNVHGTYEERTEWLRASSAAQRSGIGACIPGAAV